MDWSLVAVMTDVTASSNRLPDYTYALYREDGERGYRQVYMYERTTLTYEPELVSKNISHNRLMWWSGWSLILPGSRHKIPVVDVSVRFQPTEWTLSVDGDSVENFTCRQIETRGERLRVLDAWRESSAVDGTPLRLFPLPWMSAEPSHRVSASAAALASAASLAPVTKPKPAAKPAPVAQPTLPAFVVEALKRDAIAQGQTCPITMAPFTEAMAVAITPCYHLFTADALGAWLVNKSSCPMCKKVIKKEEISIK